MTGIDAVLIKNYKYYISTKYVSRIINGNWDSQSITLDIDAHFYGSAMLSTHYFYYFLVYYYKT